MSDVCECMRRADIVRTKVWPRSLAMGASTCIRALTSAPCFERLVPSCPGPGSAFSQRYHHLIPPSSFPFLLPLNFYASSSSSSRTSLASLLLPGTLWDDYLTSSCCCASLCNLCGIPLPLNRRCPCSILYDEIRFPERPDARRAFRDPRQCCGRGGPQTSIG